MTDEWIDQNKNSLLNECLGSTVLIRFKSAGYGITIDNGKAVDISWCRMGDDIIATTGTYCIYDIDSWKLIT